MENPDARKEAFETAVKESEVYGNWGNPNFSRGAANGGRFVDGAFYLEANLDGVSDDGVALCTRVYSGAGHETYVALVLHEHWEEVRMWLSEMKDLAEKEEGPKYSVDNSSANFFLTQEGTLRIRNVKPQPPGGGNFQTPSWNDWEGYSDPIEVDHVLTAAYPESALASNGAVTEQINALTEMVGRERITILHPWDDGDGTIVKSRFPTALSAREVRRKIEDSGGHYAPGLISRYHGGLNFLKHKHFVILKGVPGTGKTSLVKRYAEVIHGLSDADIDNHPHFHMCRVRPEWTDPTGLIGYYDAIDGKYVVEDFLEAILDARENPDKAVFVCLDEMNLARVEYYFSDILSAMEQEKKFDRTISLHNRGYVEGSNGRPIAGDQVIPDNLYITGTVNIDETTNPLSQKVRDRAVIIDMSRVELESYLRNTLSEDSDISQEAIDASTPPLIEIQEVLEDYSAGFGYRVAREVVEYVSFWLHQDVEESDLEWVNGSLVESALDHQLAQKIAVKLEGTEQQVEMLKRLAEKTLHSSENGVETDSLLRGDEELPSVKFPELLEALREKYRQVQDFGGFGMI